MAAGFSDHISLNRLWNSDFRIEIAELTQTCTESGPGYLAAIARKQGMLVPACVAKLHYSSAKGFLIIPAAG